MLAAILAVQHLGLGMTERDRPEDIGSVRCGSAIRFDACPKHGSVPGVESGGNDAYRDHGGGGRLLQGLSDLLCVTEIQVHGPIDNDLWSGRAVWPKRTHIVPLPLCYGRGRVGSFPAVVVPVIHVLAEHNQPRPRN